MPGEPGRATWSTVQPAPPAAWPQPHLRLSHRVRQRWEDTDVRGVTTLQYARWERETLASWRCSLCAGFLSGISFVTPRIEV